MRREGALFLDALEIFGQIVNAGLSVVLVIGQLRNDRPPDRLLSVPSSDGIKCSVSGS